MRHVARGICRNLQIILVIFVHVVFLSSSPPPAQTTDPDAGWSSEFGIPGIDGAVYATVEYRGELVVGGSFELPGDPPIRNVARWDGRAWQPLGQGLGSGQQFDSWDRVVTSLAVYRGDLFAGGTFRMSGHAGMAGLARWDGSSWQALPEGSVHGGESGPFVHEMAVFRDDLVVSGSFDSAGPAAAWNIASWNGSTWGSLDPGLEQGAPAMTIYNGDLVVIGRLNVPEGASPSYLSRWDGSAWHPMAAGEWILGGEAMEIQDGLLVVGGEFTRRTLHAPADLLAAWDGSLWRQYGDRLLAAPGQGEISPWRVTSLQTFHGELVIGGEFSLNGLQPEHAAAWNGKTWSSLAAVDPTSGGCPDRGARLGLHDGDLVLAACFDSLSALPMNNIARWDGTAWHAYGCGGGTLETVVALAWWNGSLAARSTSRVFVSSPGGPASLGNVLGHFPYSLLPEDDSLLVSGWRNEPGSPWRWDGQSWVRTAIGLRTGDMVRHHGRLVATGYFEQQGVSSVAEWNGTSWARLGDYLQMDDGDYVGLTVYDDRLVVCTSGRPSGDPPRVLQWNGSEWETLGIAGSGEYRLADATVFNGDLVVSGQFSEISGVSADGVARWDGSQWHSLGQGVEGIIMALLPYDDRLVAGGYTYDPRALEAAGIISIWNGSNWTVPGSGMNGPVMSLATNGTDLYVGGSFTAAGGKPSYGLARWSPNPPGSACFPPETMVSQPPYPNPFVSSLVLSYTVAARGHTRIAVFDVAGRRVADLLDRVQAAGAHTVRWDGRTSGGAPAASGTYFIRMDHEDESATWKVVRVAGK